MSVGKFKKGGNAIAEEAIWTAGKTRTAGLEGRGIYRVVGRRNMPVDRQDGEENRGLPKTQHEGTRQKKEERTPLGTRNKWGRSRGIESVCPWEVKWKKRIEWASRRDIVVRRWLVQELLFGCSPQQTRPG